MLIKTIEKLIFLILFGLVGYFLGFLFFVENNVIVYTCMFIGGTIGLITSFYVSLSDLLGSFFTSW